MHGTPIGDLRKQREKPGRDIHERVDLVPLLRERELDPRVRKRKREGRAYEMSGEGRKLKGEHLAEQKAVMKEPIATPSGNARASGSLPASRSMC